MPIKKIESHYHVWRDKFRSWKGWHPHDRPDLKHDVKQDPSFRWIIKDVGIPQFDLVERVAPAKETIISNRDRMADKRPSHRARNALTCATIASMSILCASCGAGIAIGIAFNNWPK